MAEILLGRSLKWNVHRISLQCLRGSVFPYCLWVSDHWPYGPWLSGIFNVPLTGETPHLCPTQSGHLRVTECALCAQPFVMNLRWVLARSLPWGFLLALLFLQNLRLGSIICTKSGAHFCCMSWILLLWCWCIYEGSCEPMSLWFY